MTEVLIPASISSRRNCFQISCSSSSYAVSTVPSRLSARISAAIAIHSAHDMGKESQISFENGMGRKMDNENSLPDHCTEPTVSTRWPAVDVRSGHSNSARRAGKSLSGPGVGNDGGFCPRRGHTHLQVSERRQNGSKSDLTVRQGRCPPSLNAPKQTSKRQE